MLDDADLESAVTDAMQAKLRNGGQSCIAANRLIVMDAIADDFVEGLGERLETVVMGHGLGCGVELGPVISGRALSGIRGLVDDAIADGAELRTGGGAPEGPGHFYEPTLLDHVDPSSRLSQMEIFGPVAAVTRVRSVEEAVACANDTPYGLAGYVFGRDLDRTLAVADRLEVGMVGVNKPVVSDVAAPFGGSSSRALVARAGPRGCSSTRMSACTTSLAPRLHHHKRSSSCGFSHSGPDRMPSVRFR